MFRIQVFLFLKFPILSFVFRDFALFRVFLGGVPGLLGVFRVFLWMFRVLGVFRGVPCSGVPGSTTCR